MDFLNGLGETVSSIWEKIINFLPGCPIEFIYSIPEVKKYLGMVNWFIPIEAMISLTTAWIMAIGAYYVYQLVLRWIKAIE